MSARDLSPWDQPRQARHAFETAHRDPRGDEAILAAVHAGQRRAKTLREIAREIDASDERVRDVVLKDLFKLRTW